MGIVSLEIRFILSILNYIYLLYNYLANIYCTLVVRASGHIFLIVFRAGPVPNEVNCKDSNDFHHEESSDVYVNITKKSLRNIL